jgi:ornithine cyclodeaminase/alanine dehydrogenase
MTVLSIGSTLPEQREVDAAAIGRADLLVADMLHEVLAETGDLIAARAEGIDVTGRAVALADVVAGRHPGRKSTDQTVVYKSVGSAVQDLAVAELCARAAEQRGLGARLPLPIQPIEK